MIKNNELKNQKFIPVILGGNLGAYSIARSFYEEYKAKSITISRLITGPIKHSTILETVVEEFMGNEEKLLNCLNGVEQKYPNTPKIIVCSDDWHVELIAGIRGKLASNWSIPYATNETISLVTNKARFYELCEKLDIDHPKTFVLKVDGKCEENLPFDFPVIIKPANSVTYQAVNFTDKKKVFLAETQKQFDNIISLVRLGGYMDELVIQEYVPGDDTTVHVLTCYTTKEGKTVMSSFGQIVVEDHTPTGAGNHLAICTIPNKEICKKAAKLIETIGYIGYANFDLKYDYRDGKYKFFEMNARLGRSSYYVTASGNNVAKYYVEDYIEKAKEIIPNKQQEILYSIVPKNLLLKNVKGKELKDKICKFYKTGKVYHPLKYRKIEKSIRRKFYEIASIYKFYIKFVKYPPHKEMKEKNKRKGIRERV